LHSIVVAIFMSHNHIISKFVKEIAGSKGNQVILLLTRANISF